MNKKCNKCKIEKSKKDFYETRWRGDGLTASCKACASLYYKQNKEIINERHRAYYHINKNSILRKKHDKYKDYLYRELKKDKALKFSFGISLEDYKTLLNKQGETCAICLKVCKSGRNLSVDHCHSTNIIRGLLCVNCNNGLGNFMDNTTLMLKAIEYINNSKSKNLHE